MEDCSAIARHAWAIGASCPSPTAEPRHAARATEPCRSQPLTRARFELALVLEDPAAAIHNAAFARSLLDDAERQLPERDD